MDTTDFAKRMKLYEKRETRETFNPNLPIIIRLDGKGFSKFTKPFKRPFDEDFRKVMSDTATYVMNQCCGSLSYTQSDEISIIVDRPDIFFKGKKQKIVSVLAAMATSYFVIQASKIWPDHVSKCIPAFDCRAFNVPDKAEAVNAILWRQKDCVRNSISMMGHYHFTKSDMHKKCTKEVISMLRLRKDIEWNDLDTAFKYGIYSYKSKKTREIDDQTWNKIPEKSRPENRKVERSITTTSSFDNPDFKFIRSLAYGDNND